MSPHQLNSKNDATVLSLKTIFWYLNCVLLSVAMDGKDGSGLKLEKIGQSFHTTPTKITKKV